MRARLSRARRHQIVALSRFTATPASVAVRGRARTCQALDSPRHPRHPRGHTEVHPPRDTGLHASPLPRPSRLSAPAGVAYQHGSSSWRATRLPGAGSSSSRNWRLDRPAYVPSRSAPFPSCQPSFIPTFATAPEILLLLREAWTTNRPNTVRSQHRLLPDRPAHVISLALYYLTSAALAPAPARAGTLSQTVGCCRWHTDPTRHLLTR